MGAGASTSTCSVWAWQGSSYSATWRIGAVGQLTVTSSDREPAAYNYIDKSLRARGSFSASQSIKRSWDALDKLRSGLADPLKNNSGEPAVSSVTPLTCHLP